METAKIKNIILVILLLLNGFLLSLIVMDKSSSISSESAAAQTVTHILEDAGISVSGSVDMSQEAPAAYELTRDMDTELSMVRRLLPDARAQDQGGNIILYSASGGQASLRGSGETDFLFTSGQYSRGKSAVNTVGRIMKKLGLEYDEASVRSSGGAEAMCAFKGYPVYNASLSFTFGTDKLMMISGTRLMDNAAEKSDARPMDILTVLLRFLEITREEGFVCSRLSEVSAGYIMSVPVSGESSLTPVWHFVTNTGELYINALTGRLETPA